ncbi:MAG: NADH-quinone oxidoreductase subunit NuoB [Deltaproteobacteria bacterium]|nr:NADH-quinone oxidoreductase subunit NuoB [Deltaproteobacteria bacterium]
MLSKILKSLRTGVVTTRYPAELRAPPEGFRGAPELRVGATWAALPEASVCPSGAITKSDDRLTIDLARCIFCGRCESPAEGPIQIGREFELAARQRGDLLVELTRDGADRVGAADSASTDQLSDHVRARITSVLGRSLHLRHLDTGSCNACDWELTALLNPTYDVRRLGIDFVASPRHADGIVVTGPVTRNLEAAVKRTYEAMPDPRLVVAVGACACSGGIVGASYASAGGVGEVLPVDVFIPGCPPRPEAILFGLLVAIGRIESRRTKPEAQTASTS